jgi:L-arabinose isomerase
MGHGLKGGASFMEDYTYNFKNGGQVLGAHMLEVCPSIAAGRPSIEIHPLSIGGKDDPVRLVFTAAAGRAVNASVIELSDRFRMIVNQVNIVEPEYPLPQLPVARAVWEPEPNFKTAATAWISAGGAHHTALSSAITGEHLEHFAAIAGMECLMIDKDTTLRSFIRELRGNESHCKTMNGF